MEGYCIKCRAKREAAYVTVTLKNGKQARQGVCPVCGTKIFRKEKKTIPVPRASQFYETLNFRLDDLFKLAGSEELTMPIGLFLLLDKENGGDATADEIQRRFRLLNFESSNIIDFYFLGWYDPEEYGEKSDTIKFSLEAFEEFRTLLRNLGIRKFGGYADLILLDAHVSQTSEPRLNFSQAVYIDLARQMAEGNFPTLGGLLQSIVETAEDVRESYKSAKKGSVVFSISDELGIAFAKQSILQFFLEKWGRIIGAKSLATLATRNLAPDVTWDTLQQECSRSSSDN